MFALVTYVLLYLTPFVFHTKTCTAELVPPPPPSLTLYSPGEPDYTDVLVKRVADDLSLACELRGDAAPRIYVWNYVGSNSSSADRPFTVEPAGPTLSSRLMKRDLQLADSGHYMCSAPPFSATKYILVQSRGPKQCARGAFWCGKHCVLAAYVCDGFRDCARGEDEAPALCADQPCARAGKLNCSSGRCISEAACCRAAGGALCRQPACCEEHPRYSRLEGYLVGDVEYPPLFEDRRAPDDYGFIQSTIYTVTACALIFMIAVVLLVSAICKMHMKRAALRSYAHAERATRRHYSVQYAQAHRFPPCYEASRLLEQERGAAPAPAPASPPASPALQCSAECGAPDAAADGPEGAPDASGFGLARLSALFSSRYRQVPTQCLDVEMTDVRPASLAASPTRAAPRARLADYRSPTYCDLSAELFLGPEAGACGRDLNYMATPVELYRRRALRGNLDRVLDHISRPRPLTLQLGRFQLSIPRLGRRTSLERRPDTPNVAELNIDELDFVRLNSNETYTLNGRTIRLLGADFENYPALAGAALRPPPYTEAVRCKLYGPPPEYLSRDALNDERNGNVTVAEEQARRNVEMPPRYDELAAGGGADASVDSVTARPPTASRNINENNEDAVTNNGSRTATSTALVENNVTNANVVNTQTRVEIENTNENNVTNNVTRRVIESISSVIDNLPAIDSDVNANETEARCSGANSVIDNEILVNNNN